MQHTAEQSLLCYRFFSLFIKNMLVIVVDCQYYLAGRRSKNLCKLFSVYSTPKKGFNLIHELRVIIIIIIKNVKIIVTLSIKTLQGHFTKVKLKVKIIIVCGCETAMFLGGDGNRAVTARP